MAIIVPLCIRTAATIFFTYWSTVCFRILQYNKADKHKRSHVTKFIVFTHTHTHTDVTIQVWITIKVTTQNFEVKLPLRFHSMCHEHKYIKTCNVSVPQMYNGLYRSIRISAFPEIRIRFSGSVTAVSHLSEAHSSYEIPGPKIYKICVWLINLFLIWGMCWYQWQIVIFKFNPKFTNYFIYRLKI